MTSETNVKKMLNQIVDSFYSKFTEKIGEFAFESFLEGKNLRITLETLKRNLKVLSEKAFDVEKKIMKEELSGKKKRKREVEEWLEQVKLIETKICTLERKVQTQGFLRNFISGGQATKLSREVDKFVEQSRDFGDPVVDVYETRGKKLLTTNLFGNGFAENFERIENLLRSDNVSSIRIYGMGGVRKTTLAKHVNNMVLEKIEEKRVCWIKVSRVFSMKKLQDEIARFIGLDLSDENNEDIRAARLHKAITSNFVLILDDVWEYICLEKLGDPLRLRGCKLILTTRSIEVCSRMGCQENVKVEKLSEDEAWNLFKQRLGQDIALYPEVENVAKDMTKFCGGLPLGIVVQAGSMSGETSIHVWRNALENLRDPNVVQGGDEDEVFKVLKYSYDTLDLNHKKCLLECCSYPEYFRIIVTELVGGFISKNLVDIRKSRQSQLDEAHSILDKLVKVSLLDYVDEFAVEMHYLVRRMALKEVVAPRVDRS